MHADEFFGGGEDVHNESDIKQEVGDTEYFRSRLGALARRYKFGKLDFGAEQIFCGVETVQMKDNTEITLRAEAYMHKEEPLTIEKARRAHPRDSCTPKETSMLRGLNGSVQWPASQCMVHAAAAVRQPWCRSHRPI